MPIKYIIFIIILISIFLTPLMVGGNSIYVVNENVSHEKKFIIEDLSIKDQIIYFAAEYDVDENKALAIADSESEFKNVPNYLYDGENGYRTAYGIFQITRTTYKGFCGDPAERLIPTKNIECAMIILTESGDHHWNPSRTAWEKMI